MARKTKKSNNGNSSVTTGVSLPPELLDAALNKIKTDPELDFSKYIRRLIRADLESAKVAA